MYNIGFGSFASVELQLSFLSVDEKNELYLSGGLDEMLDEAEKHSLERYKRKTRKGKEEQLGEVLQQ